MPSYDPITSATEISAAQKRITAANKTSEEALAKYKTLTPGSPEAIDQIRRSRNAKDVIYAAESEIKMWDRIAADSATGIGSLSKTPPAAEIKTSPYVAQVGELVDTRIAKLPTIKSPEIVKKQIEAEIQDRKVQIDTVVQLAKEQSVDTAKTQLKEGFVGLLPKVPAIPKLFILDPKFIAQLAYARAKQEVADFRQKLSKENLKKSKEAFTFPMKPSLTIPTIPKIPELPKLPNITLPQLPTIALPSIPPIPKIPQLPTIPKLPTIALPTIPKVNIPQLKDINIPSATDIKNIKINNIKLP
jgi:hypothetical protein